MKADRGFTLLEVLVSFVVLALVLGAAYQSIGAGARSIDRVSERMVAVTIAESVMARVGADLPLVSGEQALDYEGWRIGLSISPFDTRNRQAWTALGQEPMRVRVAVGRAGEAEDLVVEQVMARGLQ